MPASEIRGCVLPAAAVVAAAAAAALRRVFLQEDRDLVARLRPFARFSDPKEHDELIDNLLVAKKIRQVLLVRRKGLVRLSTCLPACLPACLPSLAWAPDLDFERPCPVVRTVRPARCRVLLAFCSLVGAPPRPLFRVFCCFGCPLSGSALVFSPSLSLSSPSLVWWWYTRGHSHSGHLLAFCFCRTTTHLCSTRAPALFCAQTTWSS